MLSEASPGSFCKSKRPASNHIQPGAGHKSSDSTPASEREIATEAETAIKTVKVERVKMRMADNVFQPSPAAYHALAKRVKKIKFRDHYRHADPSKEAGVLGGSAARKQRAVLHHALRLLRNPPKPIKAAHTAALPSGSPHTHTISGGDTVCEDNSATDTSTAPHDSNITSRSSSSSSASSTGCPAAAGPLSSFSSSFSFPHSPAMDKFLQEPRVMAQASISQWNLFLRVSQSQSERHHSPNFE